MGSEVDAVIEALKIALEEASREKNEDWWKVDSANRWINRLPGAWFGRWKDLKLEGDYAGEVDRKKFIGHVRATLAYLETNRNAISAMRAWSWRRPSSSPVSAEEPIDAEFKEVAPDSARLAKPHKGVRVIK